MNDKRASTTAMMVAYMRAVADAGASHVRDFHDPTARIFLDARWTQRLAAIERQMRSGRDGITLALARASADMMALRTEAIDAAVHAAVARGTTQVVILGAGFDGRAWRMRELASTRVFEVDHPATQRVKRARIALLAPPVAPVTFVPVDFGRDSLGAALAQAGHDATRPTCWIWEGVVMYLTHGAMRSTLASVAERSADGSTLIVNYHTARRSGFVGLVLRFLGEPDRSHWSPEEMGDDLRAAGFRVEEDSGVSDWAARFASRVTETRAGRAMRVAVAHRARVPERERRSAIS